VDFFNACVGGDDVGVGFVVEVEEEVAAELEGFALFELIGFAVADADAFEGVIDGEVEDDEDVGLRGEGFVLLADGDGVDPASSLVGHVGEVVAVEDDDAAASDGGEDELLDVLAAVFEKVVEFLLDGESSGGGAFAEFFPPRSVGGFKALDDLVTVLFEGFG